MSRNERPGSRELQFVASAWLHELVEKRKQVRGVDTWMVVERLVKLGLEAETRRNRTDDGGDWRDSLLKEHGETALFKVFVLAQTCLEKYFANQVGIFMRTIRKMHEVRKPLPASEWRRWVKLQQVPEEYIPTILRLRYATEGMESAFIAAGDAKLMKEGLQRLEERLIQS